ncbi:MAG: F0F1 ATP synthase subunit gamma, partial [Aureliella sp.]
MSDSTASLRQKIANASDLQSVVRSMKAMAASSIGQYENAVLALIQYNRTIELGLGACFRARASEAVPTAASVETHRSPSTQRTVGAIVFGSD